MSKEQQSVGIGAAFQDKPQGGMGLSFIIVIALIAFVSGGIVTLAVTGPSKGEPSAPEPAVSAALPAQPVRPVQPDDSTDPLKQRRPLSDFLAPHEIAALRGENPRQDQEPGVSLGATDGTRGIPETSNPDIPNPEAYQYDPVTDKHYDPEHGHWHQGKPPTILNPEPWQFDPDTNRHWDPRPRHEHWHHGPPPAPEDRGEQ